MDRAAMRFHEMPHDSETETKSAVHPRARSVGLTELVKHVRQKSGLNSNAGIGHSNFGIAGPFCKLHCYVTTLRREFDRVGKQVPNDLLKPVRISRYHAIDGLQLRVNANAFCFTRGPYGLDRCLNDRCD